MHLWLMRAIRPVFGLGGKAGMRQTSALIEGLTEEPAAWMTRRKFGIPPSGGPGPALARLKPELRAPSVAHPADLSVIRRQIRSHSSMTHKRPNSQSRREFIKGSAAAVVGAAGLSIAAA